MPSNDLAPKHGVDQLHARAQDSDLLNPLEKPYQTSAQMRVLQLKILHFPPRMTFLIVLLLLCLLINYAVPWVFWFSIGDSSGLESPHRYDLTRPPSGSNPRPNDDVAQYHEPQEYEEPVNGPCTHIDAIQPEHHRHVALALEEALHKDEHRIWAYESLKGAVRISCVNTSSSFAVRRLFPVRENY